MGVHAEMNHLDTSATAISDSMESDVKVSFMFFALPSFDAFFFLFTQNRSGKGKNYAMQIETIIVLAFNGFPVRRF